MYAVDSSAITRKKQRDPEFRRACRPDAGAEKVSKLRGERKRRRPNVDSFEPVKLAEPTPADTGALPQLDPTRDDRGFKIRPDPPRKKRRIPVIYLDNDLRASPSGVGAFASAAPPREWLDARDEMILVFGPGMTSPPLKVHPRTPDYDGSRETRLQALLREGNEVRDDDRRRLVREGLL